MHSGARIIYRDALIGRRRTVDEYAQWGRGAMLRGKKRTRELVHDLSVLRVNWPGVAYTAGCAAFVLATAAVLLVMALHASRASTWPVVMSCVVDIAAHSVVLLAIYVRWLFYLPYFTLTLQLSVLTCGLAVAKTFVMYFCVYSFGAVCVSLANIIATMMLWLVFATTVRSRPAVYVHPYLLPPDYARPK